MQGRGVRTSPNLLTITDLWRITNGCFKFY